MTSSLSTRYVFAADVSSGAMWRLLDWCVSRGATEFTLAVVSAELDSRPQPAPTVPALQPFGRGRAPRERVTVPWGEDSVSDTVLWTLCAESVAVLRELFPDGLFQYPGASLVEDLPHGEWFEDPVIFRSEAIMLGVISHEGAALLELTAEEHAEVARLGIPTREVPPWDPGFDEGAV